jgi:hypothetical protein
MAKKLNQSLLNEELKKFRLLSEYTFYNEEPKKQDDLILGAVDEADEEPADDAAADAPVDDSKTAANAGGAEGDTEGDDANNLFSTDDSGAEDAGADTGADDTDAGNMGADDIDMGADDADAGNMGADDTAADSGDEVEVDVTQIVKGSEEAKKSADLSFLKTTELLSKFNDLEKRVAAMDSISSKIDTLEKEIVKRNPTPVEKLEMRSMSSFPYNIKLTDYWKDVPGYDTGVEEPKEFVLTKDDVDSGYTDASIKDTFNLPDDYEEEELNS